MGDVFYGDFIYAWFKRIEAVAEKSGYVCGFFSRAILHGMCSIHD